MATMLDHQVTGETAKIILNGRFDFASHRDFRETYEEVLNKEDVKELIVDLAAVEYIDSSALGMLLLLRERALSHNISVKLANGRGPVKQVLEVANFSKLFEIL